MLRRTNAGPVALCLLLLCVVPKDLTPLQAASSEDTDHVAITAVLTEQQTAWNRGDVAAFMEGYWKSPQVTFAGGSSFIHGWETVLTRYQRDYPNQASMGHLDFSELEIRTLGPDAALVLGKWHLTRASGDVGGIFTLVFKHLPEGWRIVHDHTN